MNYLNLHQTNFGYDSRLIKKLFADGEDIKIAVQQVFNPFERNARNTNQILVPEKPIIVEKEYNVFASASEGFEIVEDFVSTELKLDNKVLKKEDRKELFFYVFEHKEDKPRLRGVLYASTKGTIPSFWVALDKNLEAQYDREFKK